MPEDPRDEIIRQLMLRLEKVEMEIKRGLNASRISTESDSEARTHKESLMLRSFRLPRHLERYNDVGDHDTFI